MFIFFMNICKNLIINIWNRYSVIYSKIGSIEILSVFLLYERIKYVDIVQ